MEDQQVGPEWPEDSSFEIAVWAGHFTEIEEPELPVPWAVGLRGSIFSVLLKSITIRESWKMYTAPDI